MSDEDAFLRAIQANPQDDAPRLVYADWLDERGDDQSTRKADFLRMTTRLLAARSDLARSLWEKRLRALAPAFEGEWLAAVSRLPLEACRFLFERPCPRRWENLRATADPGVRACDACEQFVHYCSTMDEARRHAQRGECVALSLGVRRSPRDLDSDTHCRRFSREEVSALGRLVTIGRLRTEVVPEPFTPSSEVPPVQELDDRAPHTRRRRRRRVPRRKRWTVDDE